MCVFSSVTLWISPPGSPVHGILQGKILDCVVISSPRGSSWPRSSASQVDFSPMHHPYPKAQLCLCYRPLLPAKDFSEEKTSDFCWVQGALCFCFVFFLDAVCIFFPPLIQEVLNDYHVEHCAANLGRWKQKPSLDSAIKSFTEHYTQTLILESAKGHV